MLQDFYRVGDTDTAVVKDENNAVVTVTTWTSSDTNVLTITNGGLFTCLAPGKAVITAKNVSNSVLAKLAITVKDTNLANNYRIE